MSVKVIGLSETLREIGKIDKEAVKQIRKDFRAIAKPAIKEQRDLMPNELPLSGLAKGRIRYSGKTADSKIGAYISTPRVRKSNSRSTASLFRIEERDPVASLMDAAAKTGDRSRRVYKNGKRVLVYKQTFTENLTTGGTKRPTTFRHPKPSRAMWPGAEKSLPQMVKETQKSIDDMMTRLNRKAKYI